MHTQQLQSAAASHQGKSTGNLNEIQSASFTHPFPALATNPQSCLLYKTNLIQVIWVEKVLGQW